jgi:hypothetical protein
MNPYLEQNDTCEDFHQNFITRTQETLSPQVGANYLVKIEVRLMLHELSAEQRRFIGRADLGVTAPLTSVSSIPPVAGLAAPVELEMPAVDVERQSSIEIRDRRIYGKYIYSETPDAPLSTQDQAWAQAFVPQPGRNDR